MPKPELKIIADHLRSSSFLIADGIMPSNEGRGYVLRRIMRRAMRQLHKLGAREASMFKLVDALIAQMGEAYPELARARAVIVETLKNEEEKFRETLEKGLKILDEALRQAQGDKKKFSGATAFKLYDTYGFPLDLTQDILKEKNLEVDLTEFDREMEAQRQRARKSWSGSGEVAEDKIFFELKEKFGATKFLGYENLSAKAKVLAVLENGIILDQTPFYATSGGQKGDDGKIADVEIFETKKFAGGLFVHFAKDVKNLKTGDEIVAQVNPKTRAMRAANHSATHLMHKALKKVLGDSISQKGSNVDAAYFTFDFNFNRGMSADEVKKVEDLVNEEIKKSSAVNTNLMALDEARKTGAEANFGEKYDAEVRVVAMGNSIELCGGTHVKNTGEIEIFKIISEKSIASGIRRIEAKTGEEAKKYLSEKQAEAKKIRDELREKINKKNQEIFELSGAKQSEENSDDQKILEEILKKKDKEVERLKKQNLFANLQNLSSQKIGDVSLLTHVFEGVEAKDLRDIVNEIKSRNEFSLAHIFAIFSCNDAKVSACVALTSDLQDKFDSAALLKEMIGSGGGKKDFAMGGGISKDSILRATEILKNRLQKNV